MNEREQMDYAIESPVPVHSPPGAVDLICLSHLRWDSVFQRPHHLMTRFARERRVFFFEEPVIQPGLAYLQVSQREGGVRVATPYLPGGLSEYETDELLRQLVNSMMIEYHIGDHLLWYYTPMMLSFTLHLQPLAIVYDCMDELSAFALAPRRLPALEDELLRRADLVFTGGMSLYEAKRGLHAHVHAFPSSVEAAHFARARALALDPPDQAGIPHPRLGFFGVIDERMDLALLQGIADARPEWHLILLGPVVKINSLDLPRRANIHYLGSKAYTHLPEYLAGWDVALLPFARNQSTRFISPTKTPEYLAGGKPVVATAIRDVVHPYGEKGLVRIAETIPEFVAAVQACLDENSRTDDWLARVDAHLAQMSWERTWGEMNLLLGKVVRECIENRTAPLPLELVAEVKETELENV